MQKPGYTQHSPIQQFVEEIAETDRVLRVLLTKMSKLALLAPEGYAACVSRCFACASSLLSLEPAMITLATRHAGPGPSRSKWSAAVSTETEDRLAREEEVHPTTRPPTHCEIPSTTHLPFNRVPPRSNAGDFRSSCRPYVGDCTDGSRRRSWSSCCCPSPRSSPTGWSTPPRA